MGFLSTYAAIRAADFVRKHGDPPAAEKWGAERKAAEAEAHVVNARASRNEFAARAGGTNLGEKLVVHHIELIQNAPAEWQHALYADYAARGERATQWTWHEVKESHGLGNAFMNRTLRDGMNANMQDGTGCAKRWAGPRVAKRSTTRRLPTARAARSTRSGIVPFTALPDTEEPEALRRPLWSHMSGDGGSAW